ncbi:hypothetical protein [Eubacterium limosum]|uniref:hypothetical protein n=1 Tax=Eubacterium limosum TaxID=1736 RepID=UPI0022DF7F30|nr:hypothetical protein [Eubacterium limosum]
MKNISLQKVMSFLYAVVIILNLNPYFLWDTYSKYGKLIQLVISMILLLFVGVYFIKINLRIKRNYVILACLYIIYYIYTSIFTWNNEIFITNGRILACLLIVITLFLPEEDKNSIFYNIRLFFAISLVPAIFYWVINFIHILIPYSILAPISEAKINAGVYYEQYFGAVVQMSSGYKYEYYRLCGIYDEPGVIGTFGALILVGDNFAMDRKNLTILLGCILSMSLAFYMVMIIYFTIRFTYTNKKKLVLYLTTILVLFSFINIFNSEDTFINRYVFSRLQIENGALSGENRTNKAFDDAFSDFLKQKRFSEILIGKGVGYVGAHPNINSVSTYKIRIIETGVIGFLFIILFYLLIYRIYAKDKLNCKFLFAVFFFLFYQRSDVMTLSYIATMLFAISNLNFKEKNGKGRNDTLQTIC